MRGDPAREKELDPTTRNNSLGRNLALGYPSGATSDPTNKTNYLVVKPNYVVSYNSDKKGPNWVSWRLQKSDLGTAPRGQDEFFAEPTLPSGFDQAEPQDFAGYYDQGHLIPRTHRTSSKAESDSVFSMANILPQAPDLNQGVWMRFENYLRDLAEQGQQFFIVAGGYGSLETIGNGVNVPSNFWQIVVILPDGEDIKQINEKTRVIAVDMPNVEGIRQDPWQKYVTTVSDIERNTGYSFFSELPQAVRDVLKSKKDQ
jgi:endonuclease G